MSVEFKDHFSDASQAYSQYRPGYPHELFSYLSSLTQDNELVWDCATGSGQSAVILSNYYHEVIATDASSNQIENAMKKQGVRYLVESAEQTSLKDNSVDLITVAQAVHWFDLAKFTSEVKRVLKRNGVLAVWTYGLMDINSEVNTVVEHLYRDKLDSYWPPERAMIEQGYRNIDFPLTNIKTPNFQMQTEWDLSQLIGYLCTWSAVKKYESDLGINPVESLYNRFSDSWGDAHQKIVVQWPLTLKVWKKTK